MKKVLVFMVFVSCFVFVSCGVTMADTGKKIDGVPAGYEGGDCLQPGDQCVNGLSCGFTDDGDKVCYKPAAVIDNDPIVTDDATVTDADNNAPTLEQNECFGMIGYYDVVPHNIVTFGTKSFQKDISPEDKVVIAGDNACSMIAYNASGAIIAPIRCEGIHYTTATQYETCTYIGALDLVDGSLGCDWNCVDYK